MLNAAFDFAYCLIHFSVLADGVDATCVLVMGGAVPQLHSSAPSLVRKPFAAVPSCVRSSSSSSNWLRLPGRRSDAVVNHGVKRTSGRHPCPLVCASATVSTRLYDGLAEDREDYIKAGGEELDLVQLQANKCFEQPKIAEKVSIAV